MSVSLFFQAIGKFLLGVVLVGVLLFLPAGTLYFFGGWLLMGILFVPMFVVGVIMMIRNPALLQSRLNAKESAREQDTGVKLSGLMFVLGFVAAGLQHRLAWLLLPRGVSVGAAVLFLAAYAMYAWVLKENTYLSRTIEVQEHQTVISTGPYRLVRHPMYSATLLLFLSMPLVLGSWIALIVFLGYPLLITRRIRHEETLLANELPGYRDYMNTVPYRLIPFVW